jgi:hypothetical protein
MKGNNIVFKRAVTSALIYKFKRELYRPVFDRTNRMSFISVDITNRMQELTQYSEKYYLNGNQDLLDSMIKLAEDNNLFDESIYSTYKEIKEIFDSLPFINPVFSASNTYNSEDAMNDAIRDLFKYYKQRIDWKHYNIKLNDEVVTPIAEDSQIEELI